MSFCAQHVYGPRPTNRIASRPHPGPRNYRIEWEPLDMHGVYQMGVNKLRGLYVTGGAAISLARRSSGAATDGGERHGTVESMVKGEYGKRAGSRDLGRGGKEVHAHRGSGD